MMLVYISENKGENYEYFVCGPSEMLQTAEKVLENNNVSKSKIHIEYFGTSSKVETEEIIIILKDRLKGGLEAGGGDHR